MIDHLSVLITEQMNEQTLHIDECTTLDILRLINNEDRTIADQIQNILPQIASAVDCVVASFQRGGRLFYVGAGTSGRLGILDASECPPTFGTDPHLVQGIIAGGMRAMKESVEGAEDDIELGISDMNTHGINDKDCVIGIAASGRTPYVIAAMKRAKQLGASVIGLSNNLHSPMHQTADLVIEAVMGPEVLLGSTRMKAGTSQKLILNMITTTAMIRMGKTYRNLMVDLKPSNEKLVARSKRIIQLASDCSYAEAERLFELSGGQVKIAVVMALTGSNREESERMLKESGGHIRKLLGAK